MSYNAQAQQLNAYKETKVRTAGQGQLILMLYDEAIKQIDMAENFLKANDKRLDRVHNAVVKAQDIITELMVSLDFEKGGEIAVNLYSLYRFFNNQLMDANMNKDHLPLVNVKRFLVDLRETWQDVVKKNGADKTSPSSPGINIAG